MNYTAVNMAWSRRKEITDGEIAELNEFWRCSRPLWDSRVPDYSNADMRKHALLTPSQLQMEGLDARMY